MSIANLEQMLHRADAIDVREGLLAYERYHAVMAKIATQYDAELPRVIAAFCALSPNNDYTGNLRSLITALHGWRHQWSIDVIQVSTYRHCLYRAFDYLAGQRDFLDDAKGLKIRSFYHNVLDPTDNKYVTIDGHMVATWRGQNLTMKEAICKGTREYREIADACKQIAFREFMLPNQVQAVIWFARKRLFHIKVGNASQYDLLSPDNQDMWETFRDLDRVKPFPKRVQARRDGYQRELAREAEQLGQQGLARLWDYWSDPAPG